jgi:glycosyltransferase involved in cell wall biosynthesis
MLFSHICCSNYITGAEKYLLFLIDELRSIFDCILVVPNEGVLSSEVKKMGQEVIVHPYPMITAIWKAGPSLYDEVHREVGNGSVNKLIDIMHKRNPDLIITNTCINPLPAVAAKNLGVPAVWIITEVIFDTPYTQQSVNFINHYSDWIIGISNTVFKPFASGKPLKRKWFILYPSWREADLLPGSWEHYRSEKRASLRLQPYQKLVGYIVSDIVLHKGLDHFIRMGIVLSRENPDVHFLIIGNPSDQAFYAECINIIQNSGCANRFHIENFEKRIHTVIPCMDILVVPSLINEGFGLTALEGLIFGKPVIAYCSGGLVEINTLTDNTEGLVPKRDIDQLVDKVRQGTQKPYCKKTARKNQRAVENVFGIKRYRTQLHQIIKVVNERMGCQVSLHINVRNRFPDGIVVKGSSSTVFLLEEGKKRPFVNGEAFYFYKYRWDQVIHMENMLLNLYPTGACISREGHFIPNSPSTLLVKGTEPLIYLWSEGNLHPISSSSIFARLRYEYADVVAIPDPIIHALPKSYPIGDDVLEIHPIIDKKLYRAPSGAEFYSERQQLREIEGPIVFGYFKWNPECIIDLTPFEFSRCSIGMPLLS